MATTLLGNSRLAKGVKEQPDTELAGLCDWLRENGIVCVWTHPYDSACELVVSLLPNIGKAVLNSVIGFVRNFLFKKHSVERLYGAEFINMLSGRTRELEELLLCPEAAEPLLFLSILSNIQKTRVVFVRQSKGRPAETCLGSDEFPSKVCVVSFQGKLFGAEKFRSPVCEPRSNFPAGFLPQNNLPFRKKNLEDGSSPTASERSPISPQGLEFFANQSKISSKEASEGGLSDSDDSIERLPWIDQSERHSLWNDSGISDSIVPKSIAQTRFHARVIREDPQLRSGMVKFFSSRKEYGFIISEGKEIFLHKDDLLKVGIDVNEPGIAASLTHRLVQFRLIDYQGLSKISSKAVDIKFL